MRKTSGRRARCLRQFRIEKSLLLVFPEPCHPDVASHLTQVKHYLVAGNCNVHSAVANIEDRASYLVDVVEGQRLPYGPLRLRLNRLRPEAGKAVTVRDKVDAVAIRRPTRFVVPVRVADDLDPV